MARPDHRKAAKDYPAQGILKGEMYWYVKLKLQRGGVVKRQKSPFKRSQLTTSDYYGPLYDWEDSKAEITSMDDAQQFADDIGNHGEEQQGKFDNMPEGLQQGDTGQMIETRAQACEAAKDAIEEIISEWESAKDTWESEIETYKEELSAHESSQAEFDEWESTNNDLEEGEDNPEPEPTVEAEPDLPDNTLDNGDGAYEFDESEWLDRVREVSVDE